MEATSGDSVAQLFPALPGFLKAWERQCLYQPGSFICIQVKIVLSCNINSVHRPSSPGKKSSKGRKETHSPKNLLPQPHTHTPSPNTPEACPSLPLGLQGRKGETCSLKGELTTMRPWEVYWCTVGGPPPRCIAGSLDSFSSWRVGSDILCHRTLG